MNRRKMLLSAGVLLVLVLFSVPCFAQQVLKIGNFVPLTGPGAYWGKCCSQGITLGVDEWNKRGGVSVKGQKYRLELLVEDDKYRGEEAVKAVNKLIFTDKVKFIAGPFASACVLAAQPITEANKVIMVCNSFAGIDLLRNKPYTFRVMVPPLHSGPAFFKLLTKRYPGLKTYVHISPNDATGWASAQGDNDACDAVGIKILANEFFETGTQDFTPILTKAIPLKPDFLSIAGSAGGYQALIIKQARELGYKGRFIHSGHIQPDELGPIAGWESIEGMLSSSLATEGPLCPPGVKKVAGLWRAKFGEKEAAGFATGGFYYDYVNILCWGIEKANSLDPDEVRKAIENLGDIETLTGTGRWGGKEYYGANHQMINPHMVSEVKNRKLIVAGLETPWEVPPPQKKWR